MVVALKMFFPRNQLVLVHNSPIFPRTYLFRRKRSGKEGNVRAPKRVGGRTRITNKSEGLSEDLIIEKKLRTPSGSEDERTRENRLQEIRRLQALRWYEYKSLIPRWERLFAMKNPWSDVKSLRPKWTKDNRPPPPADAHPTALKTPDDFKEIVEAREARAQKIKEAKARKEAAAAEGTVEVGPSAKSKGGKKSAKRQKKVVIVSPPDASSEGEANSDDQDPGTEADVEDIPQKKKPSSKGIRIQEPAAQAPRATIDMTNLVTDPPISSTPSVQVLKPKPSAKSKEKQAQVDEDDETLIQRKERLAKQKEQEEKYLINSKLLNFHS